MDHLHETGMWRRSWFDFNPWHLHGAGVCSEVFALQKQPTNSKTAQGLYLLEQKKRVDYRIDYRIMIPSIIIWQCFKIISNFHRMNSLRFEKSTSLNPGKPIDLTESEQWKRAENLVYKLRIERRKPSFLIKNAQLSPFLQSRCSLDIMFLLYFPAMGEDFNTKA